MAGFFARRIGRWAVEVQRREMELFAGLLKGMGEEELGFAVAVATHERDRSAYKEGLLDPIILVARNPQLPGFIKNQIRLMQKNGRTVDAAGWMIWLHTLRAAVSLELRSTARNMWGELSRGFGSVHEAAENHRLTLGVRFDTERAAVFPIGMEPVAAPQSRAGGRWYTGP